MKRPTICAAIIARNEERDLPKCIRSLAGVADEVIVVDTGSTDGTAEAAFAAMPGKVIVVNYLEASEPNPDKPGEWRLTNFAKARNHAIELAEARGSHVLWIDSDDVLLTPLALRRAAYMPRAVYGVWIELGGTRQVHHRLWPSDYKVRFKGWVHEFAVIDGLPMVVLNDCCIKHDATPHEGAGENSNERNLRILTKQWAAEPDARCAFYLGNTHQDAGRLKDAIVWYRKRLTFGDAWLDEYLFAMLYLSRCLIRNGDQAEAAEVLYQAIDKAPGWQEFRMELANLHYKQKHYAEAIAIASGALDKPIQKTPLWREEYAYKDAPARLISWCHEFLGNRAQALVWSTLATRLIGHWDADWSKREAVLEQRLAAPIPQAPGILKGLRPKIALHRPGAIGDILMTLNLIPAFKEENPGVDVHYFCDEKLGRPDALGSIMVQAGVDMVMASQTLDNWRKQYEKIIDLVGYPLADGYPERPMGRHLLEYFADELDLSTEVMRFDNSIQGLPQLTLRRPERPDLAISGDYFTWQPRAGWSKYKQWPTEKWEHLFDLLPNKMPFVALIDESRQWSLAKSIAVFANARFHVGIDSFCNHFTNYLWTDEHGARRVPGIILWGSTQASAAGYPDNVNISKGLPCQPCFRENPALSRMPRGPCINPPRATYEDDAPHACMDAITVEEVVEAVKAMWAKTA